MPCNFKSGYLVGNGAAINVELGWYPDCVIVTNLTDGDLMTIGHLNRMAIPFSSGGTTEIVVGNTIVGATSAAEAVIDEILLYSGSWAGGDAAGFFIVRDITGTFGSENVYVGTGTNDAAVTAAVTPNVAIAAAVASATGNAALSRYEGVAGSAAKGFTIGLTVAEEAKLLHWQAFAEY